MLDGMHTPEKPAQTTNPQENGGLCDIGWSLEQVITATGGSLVVEGKCTVFRSVSTDTRKIKKGDLFVALIGKNFNGHNFVQDAIDKGACGLIVSTAIKANGFVTQIIVEDTLKALGDMASFRRQQMKNLKVIGITGSSGKTTVKEMAACIGSQNRNVLKTEGNFNNLIGLPLSLLPVEEKHDLAVLEMGMNSPGEIARLTEIADPDIACIVNIQESHLQGLGSIDNVAAAKGELFAGVRADAFLVVNIDDPRVKTIADQKNAKKVTYGLTPEAELTALHITANNDKGMRFVLRIGDQQRQVSLAAFGIHNVSNALAASACCHAAGFGFDDICQGLEAFKPFGKRFQVTEAFGGVKLIDDAYNANPSSVLAALDTLKALSQERKTVVVLGDMLELGDYSRAAHRSIGEAVATRSFDFLMSVGNFANETATGALSAGMAKGSVVAAETKEEIAREIKEMITDGRLTKSDWILIKGSRGMKMETIIEMLIPDEKGES